MSGGPLLHPLGLAATFFIAMPELALSQGDHVRLLDPAWTGCWTIRMHDSVSDLARALLIRLDSTPTHRGSPPNYYGSVLRGAGALDGSPNSLAWAAQSRDSLAVTIIGLGGYRWRFQGVGPSLAGQMYHHYDVLSDETPLGPASARRSECR